MAYTQTDLDRLQSAIAKGARRVKLNNEEIEFRSLAEMERLERKIQRELGSTTRNRVMTVQTESGWR